MWVVRCRPLSACRPPRPARERAGVRVPPRRLSAALPLGAGCPQSAPYVIRMPAPAPCKGVGWGEGPSAPAVRRAASWRRLPSICAVRDPHAGPPRPAREWVGVRVPPRRLSAALPLGAGCPQPAPAAPCPYRPRRLLGTAPLRRCRRHDVDSVLLARILQPARQVVGEAAPHDQVERRRVVNLPDERPCSWPHLFARSVRARTPAGAGPGCSPWPVALGHDPPAAGSSSARRSHQ